MKESELAEIFIDWFNDGKGYEVYPEVPVPGGVIDFVATDGTIQIGCEVKRSLGMVCLEQCYRRQPYFHYVYACVPHTRRMTFKTTMAKQLDIGVIIVGNPESEYRTIKENAKPKLNRKARGVELKDYMKASTAGSQSDRVTAFGHTVNQIENALSRNNGRMHIDDVLEAVDYHYSSISSAKSSLRKWINTGVIEGIEWNRGVLSLKEEVQNGVS